MQRIVLVMALAACGVAWGQVKADDERLPATLKVQLPSDAKLYIDDELTQSTSSIRQLETPPLKVGKEYSYTLEGRVYRDGRWIVDQREVTVRAGKVTKVVMDFPDEQTRGYSSSGDGSGSTRGNSSSRYYSPGDDSPSSSGYSSGSDGPSYSSGGSGFPGRGDFSGSGRGNNTGGAGGNTGHGSYQTNPNGDVYLNGHYVGNTKNGTFNGGSMKSHGSMGNGSRTGPGHRNRP